MQEGLYPNLVVEKRNNDFAYIDIANLDIVQEKKYTNLYSLDLITRLYSEQELKDSITRANIVPDVDISDKKLLIKYGNYKLPVLTRDVVDSFNFVTFIRESFGDKSMRNIIYNKLAAIVKDEQRAHLYKGALSKDTYKDFLYSLQFLSYTEYREFCFYLYNYVAKKEEIGDNKRKREKVND